MTTVAAAWAIPSLEAHPSSHARADGTRSRLLATAERLMAERGVRGVGLKEISVAAGQRNNSAAQYHFGSRAGLVEAVFVNRMRAVNARRRCMLDALVEPRTPGPRPFVAIQIDALLDVVSLDGGSWFASFLAQAFADDEFRHLLDLQHEVKLPTRDLIHLLDRELSFLPSRVRRHRIEYANITIVNVLAAYERAGRAHGPLRSDRRAVAAELTDAVVGMLDAPTGHSRRRGAAPTSGRA
jgi:AcrR family transcriptional regulator